MDLYDAMVSYELGELNSSLKGAKVQFNVNNLANTKYVASCASDSACFYGIGRTVTATSTTPGKKASAGLPRRTLFSARGCDFLYGRHPAAD
jgi:outer membrane receptor protein involved in Fe transport